MNLYHLALTHFQNLRANVAKHRTFSKYGGNSQKINLAHILKLGRPKKPLHTSFG